MRGELELARMRPVPVPGLLRNPWVRRLLILGILLVAWQAYVTAAQVKPLLFPSPAAVADALARDLASFSIPRSTLTTLQFLVIGTVVGAALGLLLAAFSITSPVGHDLLSILTSIFNPLPGVAILPLAMIWFGLTPTAIIFVVAYATIWPIAISTDMGFRTVSPTLQMVARTLGLKGFRLVADVLLPAALPHLLSGLKVAWAFGWRTVVAAELVFGVAGAQGGLGWYINTARYFLETPRVFAGLVVISLLGIAVEYAFRLVEFRTIERWGMKKAG
jgi:NitT/TauT family transport system permease protein